MLLKHISLILLVLLPASNLFADCTDIYALPDNQWRQISLPCAAPSGATTVAAILGDDMGAAAVYGENWVLYAYDPGSNTYLDVGFDSEMTPGLGYWIFNRTGNPRQLSMPAGSQPVTAVNNAQCPADTSCIEVPLNYAAERVGQEQFNMIGIPSANPFSWGDLQVADTQLCSAADESGSGCTLDEAQTKNIFQSTAWQFNGNGYDTVTQSSALSAWNGLWAVVLSSAQPNSELRLQLPVDRGQCSIFPTDNPWNQDISNLPVHPNSDNYMSSIGVGGRVHADFGTVYNNAPNGIPFIEVNDSTPLREVAFLYASESDPGPYPIPDNPAIEGGSAGTGDRHIIMFDRDDCKLYELFNAWPPGSAENPFNDRWYAGSGAIFDLTSNQLRPDSWTSADAAGLPIYPGLVKYEETVIDKEIKHALRFTVQRTQRAYIHPATHFASSSTDSDLPPMGLRVRLKQNFNIDGFSEEVQTVLKALKKYGMLLADNGSNWFISGAPDPRWNDDNLSEFHNVPGSAFEAVYTGELITP